MENGYISINNSRVLKKDVLKQEKNFINQRSKIIYKAETIVKTDYGFKNYTCRLSITSPLNGKYQIAALDALR